MAEKKINIKLIKKILSILWKIFYQLFILVCIGLILIIFMQRITNSSDSINGYRLFRVISGSMVPQYDIGQVVVCKDIEVSNIKVGDTIVYRGDTGEFDGKIIMHNVVSIKTDEKGNTIVVTQGLYNTVGDPEISESQIYGKVVAKAQILTWLYDLSNNAYTFFIIIVILVLNVFISWKKPNNEQLALDDKGEEEEEIVYEKIDLENDDDGEIEENNINENKKENDFKNKNSDLDNNSDL